MSEPREPHLPVGSPSASQSGPPLLNRSRVLILVALMVLAALASEWLRPTYRLAEHKPPIVLDRQIPEAFGDWKVDRSIIPVLPDPSLQAALDVLYSQTLARTYINSKGQRVMLSIAYGSDQSNEATAVHRPEFCYSAQGFRVKYLGEHSMQLLGAPLQVARLIGELGQRVEPITYWITLDEAATLPGLGRKLQQLRLGLLGKIADGMLVRVSSISSSQAESFELQRVFLEQMYLAMPAGMRNRYFGERSPA
jgi:EpsI family protein